MRKILMILLCLFTMMSLITCASLSSQKNTWKQETEKSWKEQNRLTKEYKEYRTKAEEEIASLTTERDAFSLLTQAMETENIALHQQVDELTKQLFDTTATLEEKLIQAQADQAFAEQRLQEVMNVLLTPAPVPSPSPTPLPEENAPASAAEENDFSFAQKLKEQFLQLVPSPDPQETDPLSLVP